MAIERQPEAVSVPLTLFNGGTTGQTADLLIHGSLPAPAPTPVVVAVDIRSIDDGAFGLRATAEMPPFPGGASLLAFSLTTKRLLGQAGAKRGYAMARCSYRRSLQAKMSFAFDDGSSQSSTIHRECVPRD